MISIFSALLLTALSAGGVDKGAIEIFVESRRSVQDGPGRIIATSRANLNDDLVDDTIVVYTYEHGPNSGDRVWGQYLVAFLSAPDGTHTATDVLFVPHTELIINKRYGLRGRPNREIELTADKYLPGDDKCCPSGEAILVFTVEDNRVIALSGNWSRKDPR